MSNYEECFSFDIPNAHILLELKIIPSQNHSALCVKIYRADSNDYEVYWNWGLTSREFAKHVIQFATQKYPLKYNSLKELTNSEEFIKYIKRFTPVYYKTISRHDAAIIDSILNANWGPSSRANNGGLDGHSYFLSIYDNSPRKYETWCTIPSEWSGLAAFIRFVVDEIVKVKDDVRELYLPYGTLLTKNNIPDIEIPLWMKK